MDKMQADMNSIDESLQDLRKLAELAGVFGAALQSAREKYEAAVSRRMEKLARIEDDLKQALLQTDLTVDDYRRLCRSTAEQVSRLRGVNSTQRGPHATARPY